MSDFRTSTHRERWIFQPHDLAERWAAANQRAAETLAQYGTTRLKVDPVDGSLSYPEPAPDYVEGSSDVKPLSCEEEQLTRVFYEQKIQEVCAAFKFPHKIQATAIIYFKRFYLQWSVMEHHPKHIMLTCVYASCKVEENHVSAEELGKGIQQDHQIILNNEMVLLKSLDFDLIVYAPYRSTEGYIDDLEDFCRAGNGAFQRLKELHQTAVSQIDKMMLTDAPLLYTPGQLALAALHKSNDVHRVFNFERYLESIFSRQHSDCSVEQFVQSINAINYLVDQLNIPTVKDMRHIDRKLKHCLDPSSHDEHKKKEKKSKHKSKRTANDAQLFILVRLSKRSKLNCGCSIQQSSTMPSFFPHRDVRTSNFVVRRDMLRCLAIFSSGANGTALVTYYCFPRGKNCGKKQPRCAALDVYLYISETRHRT